MLSLDLLAEPAFVLFAVSNLLTSVRCLCLLLLLLLFLNFIFFFIYYLGGLQLAPLLPADARQERTRPVQRGCKK